jgi:diadenosine tetraphosphate (Ap4A) HIT family hydrolase
MNATMKKFGYPETCIQEFDRWVLLLRPKQVTLGALVLICTESATAFSMLSREAFIELGEITRQIEGMLSHAFAYDKINYLMLMMVDPDVHFHVLPRYAQPRAFGGLEFQDFGWPGPPRLEQVNTTDTPMNKALIEHLQATAVKSGLSVKDI